MKAKVFYLSIALIMALMAVVAPASLVMATSTWYVSTDYCPTCPYFALTVDASAGSCCTVKVNGKEITYFPWTHVYDRGTSITLEASGGACCQFGNWTINYPGQILSHFSCPPHSTATPLPSIE